MIKFNKRKLLDPLSGCCWAEKMVLNPAMIADPSDPERLYMLFRSTGPWPQAQQPGCPLPYPIFLGFGESRDGGKNWKFDFSRPAFAPRLEYNRESFISSSFRDGKMFDFANGCIEDPRLFDFENEVYLSVACRAFPPGPYWKIDNPVQCSPSWASDPELGRAVNENSTVSMLYKVDIAALSARDYAHAFCLVAPLHMPDVSDDRDVVLFPRRLNIGGKDKIVCIHRPKHPWNYEVGRHLSVPSIFFSAADNLDDFYHGRAQIAVFASNLYDWEANRIGASFAPIELTSGEWLLPYHGKQNDQVGYTQSFMILRENGSLLPEIIARPSRRLLYANEAWELEGDFNIPCLFTCSGVVTPDGRLLMGYGAADSRIGIAEGCFADIIAYVRSFDAQGKLKSHGVLC
ncbi:MAG: hypothetical protein JXR78_04280 [Victivallales bacterium]|nr:hypothetical protein [Victivallales bacterium]